MRKLEKFSIALVFFLIVAGCGGGGGGPASLSGPASINGNTYIATISTGSGGFASSGSYKVSFSASTYNLVGSGSVADSNGTYSYLNGIITLEDTILSSISCRLNFTSETSGTYTCSGPSNSGQSGTFALEGGGGGGGGGPATGILFGVATDLVTGESTLVTVDVGTGAISTIGATGLLSVSAIDYDPLTEKLYATGKVNSQLMLAELDRLTGASILIAVLSPINGNGSLASNVADMSFRSDGVLFARPNRC